MAVTVDEHEILTFADAAAWETWLTSHHEQPGGIWLRIAKKGSGKMSVSISDALDIALCYGWIDSQRKGWDADYYLQRYSPRRPKSPWSTLNVKRVEALIEAGRMRERGLAEVAAAKQDGRWAAAYGPQRNVEVPPELASALEQSQRAKAAFEQMDKTSRYLVILAILMPTTPEARAVRVQKEIAKLEGRYAR